jgi:DNA polymerase-3 subunit alpha
MAFVTLEDITGSLEIVIFPGVYEKYSSYLDGKQVIVVTGRINGDKVIADRILSPAEALKESHRGIHILLNNPVDEDALIRLRDLFIQNKGSCNIFIHTSELEKSQRAIKASTFLMVEPSEELLAQMRKEDLVEKAWVT